MEWIGRTLTVLTAGVIVAAAPCVTRAQSAQQPPLAAAVAAAKTRADHDAIAKRYDQMAVQARADAAMHRELAASYRKMSGTIAEKSRVDLIHHCNNLADNDEMSAADYWNLAAAHREMAKQTR